MPNLVNQNMTDDKDHHMTTVEVAVVGAGPAGVAMAVSLRDRGLRPLLIEKAEVAASWRGRYDRLKLNTGRPFSKLPNRPYPKGTPMFPRRDEVVDYFDRHSREAGIELSLGTEVKRIDRLDGTWLLQTSTGGIVAHQVVVATGEQHTPRIPRWPGADDFTESCCTPRPTAIPRSTAARRSSSSARARRAWRSRTIWRPVVPITCGWQCGHRRTSC
jgi:cation diffusion facilitator CzcD-associated flavoprotein CzcO